MDVSGKKAVVFGGTSGIGLAAARQLAALGAEVVAISRNPDRAGAETEGMTLEACDVRDEAALQALFEKLAPFDILISAATGGDRAVGPFMSMDMAGFRASFDKMWGYANVVRYGVPQRLLCVRIVRSTAQRLTCSAEMRASSTGNSSQGPWT